LEDQICGFWMCGCHQDYFSVGVGQGQKIKNARPVGPCGTSKRRPPPSSGRQKAATP
jgi:hypothetical protein